MSTTVHVRDREVDRHEKQRQNRGAPSKSVNDRPCQRQRSRQTREAEAETEEHPQRVSTTVHVRDRGVDRHEKQRQRQRSTLKECQRPSMSERPSAKRCARSATQADESHCRVIKFYASLLNGIAGLYWKPS